MDELKTLARQIAVEMEIHCTLMTSTMDKERQIETMLDAAWNRRASDADKRIAELEAKVAGLEEELDDREEDDCENENALVAAESALASANARIAELEAALEPFALAAKDAEIDPNDETFDLKFSHVKDMALTRGCFRRARLTLPDEEPQT